MSLDNRVTPHGEVVDASGRGTWTGNRGLLHDVAGGPVVRPWRTRAWITCALDFRGQRLPLRAQGLYTPLFFLDEALSLAAGHRPCALCRRPAYNAYRDALGERLLARDLDDRLHGERLEAGAAPRGQLRRRLHGRPWRDLPGSAYVVVDDRPARVEGDLLRPWLTGNALGDPVPRPRSGTATVLTPPTSLAALAGGYPVDAAG